MDFRIVFRMADQISYFTAPDDLNVPIWRYLDFTKFVDLLDTKHLFFTRADRFGDRFEGSYPRKTVATRKQRMMARGLNEENARGSAQLISTATKAFTRYTAINCWHMNEVESAAMWRLYLKSNEGIALRSDYSRLRGSFLPFNETIHIGTIKYVDYETEFASDGSISTPFLLKRKSFEHERELRAVICRLPTRKDHFIDISKDSISDGIRVPVDLDKLISHVYVAPDSPAWLTNLVKSVTEKYSVKAPVVQSSLSKDPVY